MSVVQGGSRGQSYDLSIPDQGDRTYLRAVGLEAGKYEVKSLWRKSEGRAFDRRFKVGQRGERIYGRRDSEIKAFALSLEEQVDSVLEHAVSGYPKAAPGSVTSFVDETHEFVDLAMSRRHSKSFMARLERLARASLSIPAMLTRAHAVVHGGVQAHDIVRGFDDLEGIFIVAGPIYTLVTKAEMPRFLAFDSASSEGPKLRWAGPIPSEKTKSTTSKPAVVPSKQDNERKAKKETKK
ncbi:MAG TPA: hypothetical protein VFT74_18760 [Isosphaeraceae bacterium]|nr:hypothetical protein [Isosphaeraceae bacterium]